MRSSAAVQVPDGEPRTESREGQPDLRTESQPRNTPFYSGGTVIRTGG